MSARRRDEAEWVQEQIEEGNRKQRVRQDKDLAEVVAATFDRGELYLYWAPGRDLGVPGEDVASGLLQSPAVQTGRLKSITIYGVYDAQTTITPLIEIFPQILAKTPLESVFIGDCQIGDSGVTNLCGALRAASRLSSLNLTLTGMRDEGAVAVAELISENKAIKSVTLHANRIAKRGLEALLASLDSNELVTTLKVEGSSSPELAKAIKTKLQDPERSDRALLAALM